MQIVKLISPLSPPCFAMVQAIPANDLTLRQVKEQFGLVQVDGTAIATWQAPFAAPSDLERQLLDRVQTNYGYLSERSLAEGLVNMVVVSPLLDLAGFYQPPFDVDIEFEGSIPIQAEGDESPLETLRERTLVKGPIDLLVSYSLSPIFSMTAPNHELYSVLSILKRIGTTLLP